MQDAVVEMDGVPAQRHDLGGTQPVPVGDEHHGGVAIPVAVLAGGGDQLLDLGIGQIFPAAKLDVPAAPWRAAPLICPINSGWPLF